jgi:hypothetical protein
VNIAVPERTKLFTLDNCFLEDYAFLTIESPFDVKSLQMQAHFGPEKKEQTAKLAVLKKEAVN